MRVIVCGSRRWPASYMPELRKRIRERLIALPLDTIIIHGSARGVDETANREARILGLAIEAHPANWAEYGDAAGPIRNREMADAGADLCIAFWNGNSTGTRGMLEEAEKRGIETERIILP